MRRTLYFLGISLFLLGLLGTTAQPASSDSLPKGIPRYQLTPPGGPGNTPTPTNPPPPTATNPPPPTNPPVSGQRTATPTPQRTVVPVRTATPRTSLTPIPTLTPVPTIPPGEDGVLDDRDSFTQIPITVPQQQELYELLTDTSTAVTVTPQDDLSIIEADPATTPDTATELGTGALIRFVYIGYQAQAIDIYLGASEVPIVRRIETLTGTAGFLRVEAGLIRIVVTTSDDSKRVLVDEYGVFQAQNAYTLLIGDPATTVITSGLMPGNKLAARFADRPSQVFVLREDLRPTSGGIRIGVSIGPIQTQNTTFASRDLRRTSSVRFQPGETADVGSGDVKPLNVTLVTTDGPTPGVLTNVQNVPTRPDRVYNVVITNAPGSDRTAAIVLVSDPIRDYPPPKARR